MTQTIIYVELDTSHAGYAAQYATLEAQYDAVYPEGVFATKDLGGNRELVITLGAEPTIGAEVMNVMRGTDRTYQAARGRWGATGGKPHLYYKPFTGVANGNGLGTSIGDASDGLDDVAFVSGTVHYIIGEHIKVHDGGAINTMGQFNIPGGVSGAQRTTVRMDWPNQPGIATGYLQLGSNITFTAEPGIGAGVYSFAQIASQSADRWCENLVLDASARTATFNFLTKVASTGAMVPGTIHDDGVSTWYVWLTDSSEPTDKLWSQGFGYSPSVTDNTAHRRWIDFYEWTWFNVARKFMEPGDFPPEDFRWFGPKVWYHSDQSSSALFRITQGQGTQGPKGLTWTTNPDTGSTVELSHGQNAVYFSNTAGGDKALNASDILMEDFLIHTIGTSSVVGMDDADGHGFAIVGTARHPSAQTTVKDGTFNLCRNALIIYLFDEAAPPDSGSYDFQSCNNVLFQDITISNQDNSGAVAEPKAVLFNGDNTMHADPVNEISNVIARRITVQNYDFAVQANFAPQRSELIDCVFEDVDIGLYVNRNRVQNDYLSVSQQYGGNVKMTGTTMRRVADKFIDILSGASTNDAALLSVDSDGNTFELDTGQTSSDDMFRFGGTPQTFAEWKANTKAAAAWGVPASVFDPTSTMV